MQREMTILLQGTDFVGPEQVRVSGFTSDSRKVQDGDVFIAIPGYETDGHTYIPQAITNGAAAIVLEDMVDTQGLPTYQVPSSRRALSRIAASWYDFPANKLTIIGVTGTNGKTTIVNILRTIFQAAHGNAASIGTLGYTIRNELYPTDLTTPEAPELQAKLAEMVEQNIQTVAMEVSSHALVLERVADIQMQTGIFTNLGRDHYDFHSTLEHYRAAKGTLFHSLPRDGYALLNMDSPEYSWFAEISKAPVVSYSLENTDADYYCSDYSTNFSGNHATIKTPAGSIEIHTQLLGRYNLRNTIAAVATADLHGIDKDTIRSGIKNIPSVAGRLELVQTSADMPKIYVDYAHTPDALEAALSELVFLRNAHIGTGEIFVVFGCGGNRDKQKRPEMGAIAEQLADTVIVTSDNPRDENPLAIIDGILAGISRESTIIEPDREKAIFKALELATANDLVLIAGKGHEDYQIIRGKKYDFDDKSKVQLAISELKNR